METRVRTRGVVDVLEVRGQPGVRSARVLRDRILTLVEKGEPFIVVNLSRVRSIDSSWLGQLVVCRERVREHDGSLKIVACGRPRELFVASGLDRVFEIYDDEEEALDSFAPASATAGVP